MVAVWVAIQCSAAPFRQDRSWATVQLEPIGTTPPRAANAVGCNHPPGFKSPILRLLSSGFTRSFFAGSPLLSAFRAPCVALAWPRPSSGRVSISFRTRAVARASTVPGVRAASPLVTTSAGRDVRAPRPALDLSRMHRKGPTMKVTAISPDADDPRETAPSPLSRLHPGHAGDWPGSCPWRRAGLLRTWACSTGTRSSRPRSRRRCAPCRCPAVPGDRPGVPAGPRPRRDPRGCPAGELPAVLAAPRPAVHRHRAAR